MRLIDADELLERLRNAEAFFKHETAGDFDTGRALGLNEARQKVAEQPTIEAEPVKRGRWIDKPYERWKAYDVRYCSKCNWSIHKNHLRKTDLNWNFCPNCGARMDGGDEK